MGESDRRTGLGFNYLARFSTTDINTRLTIYCLRDWKQVYPKFERDTRKLTDQFDQLVSDTIWDQYFRMDASCSLNPISRLLHEAHTPRFVD